MLFSRFPMESKKPPKPAQKHLSSRAALSATTTSSPHAIASAWRWSLPASATSSTESRGTPLSPCDLRFSDSAQLSSQSKLIETREGKGKKQTDAPLQYNKCIAERPVNLFRSSSDYCGIGNSPMCS